MMPSVLHTPRKPHRRMFQIRLQVPRSFRSTTSMAVLATANMHSRA